VIVEKLRIVNPVLTFGQNGLCNVCSVHFSLYCHVHIMHSIVHFKKQAPVGLDLSFSISLFVVQLLTLNR
jgi:hypothetical protein